MKFIASGLPSLHNAQSSVIANFLAMVMPAPEAHISGNG
jgi:hypothetical protein